jgi:hypothetical protein
MPKDQKRRQKSLERHAAKRKQRKHALVRQAAPSTSSPRGAIRSAAKWPLYECLISRDWEEPGELVQILVARSSPEGAIGASVFLVDLGCLGVKNAFTRYFLSRGEYEALRRSISESQRLKKADLDLAAKIIQEGINYAERLGFKPHPDYYDAAMLLEGADPAACPTPIPLGVDGKPFFVSGPHDNVPRIMAKLERAVGPGNYDFVAELTGLPDDLEIE